MHFNIICMHFYDSSQQSLCFGNIAHIRVFPNIILFSHSISALWIYVKLKTKHTAGWLCYIALQGKRLREVLANCAAAALHHYSSTILIAICSVRPRRAWTWTCSWSVCERAVILCPTGPERIVNLITPSSTRWDADMSRRDRAGHALVFQYYLLLARFAFI